jgi:hypothetical protein
MSVVVIIPPIVALICFRRRAWADPSLPSIHSRSVASFPGDVLPAFVPLPTGEGRLSGDPSLVASFPGGGSGSDVSL